MKWIELEPGDVVLDVDAGKYQEAVDYIIVAKLNDHLLVMLNLCDGSINAEAVIGDVPGYYDVVRGDVVVQKAVTAEDVL